MAMYSGDSGKDGFLSFRYAAPAERREMLSQTNRRCSPRSVSVRVTAVLGRERDAGVWLAGPRPSPLPQVTAGLRLWYCGEGCGRDLPRHHRSPPPPTPTTLTRALPGGPLVPIPTPRCRPRPVSVRGIVVQVTARITRWTLEAHPHHTHQPTHCLIAAEWGPRVGVGHLD